MNEAVVPAEKILCGDTRYVARLLSMVENDVPQRIGVLKALCAMHAGAGNAHVVGITGPPGAGKSTITDKIVIEYRLLGKKVGVLAVDPSSPFSGGAILGDRIRMQRHATDENVFIRSLATRGHLGGLSQAVCESARVLDAAGFDVIIIETVGVGQSEVDIVRCADTIVLVSVPGLGDDIQIIKAGIMEIGDIFIVNKADRDGAQRVQKEIKSMLEAAAMNGSVTRFSKMFEERARLNGKAPESSPKPQINAVSEAFQAGAFHHIAAAGGHPNLEIPPVLLTVAETGEGVKELVRNIEAHGGDLRVTGFLDQRRAENIAWELKGALSRQMLKEMQKKEAAGLLNDLAKSVVDNKMDFYDALDRLSTALNIQYCIP